MDCDGAFLRHLKTDDVRLSGSDAPPGFRRIDPAAGAVVPHLLFILDLFLANALESLRGADAVISMSPVDQLACILLVDFFALGLPVRGVRPTHIRPLIPI